MTTTQQLLSTIPRTFTSVVVKRRLTALDVEPGHDTGEILLRGLADLMKDAGVRRLRPDDLTALANMLGARAEAGGSR